MEHLKDIYTRAAQRHGGARALDRRLSKPKIRAAVSRTSDAKILAVMTRAVFQAGFVWRVVEHKWPGFEQAFDGFDPAKQARMTEKKAASLARDERIVRNPQKIRAVRDNARFLVELASEHGKAAKFFSRWPAEDMVGLWDVLKRRGSRLGGFTGPFVLRHIGLDTFMLTADVLRVLRANGVIQTKGDTAPSSRKALQRVQEAFNTWHDESGRSLNEISQILAHSVGDIREELDGR